MSQADAVRPGTGDTVAEKSKPAKSGEPTKSLSQSEPDSSAEKKSVANEDEQPAKKKSLIDKLPGWVGFHLRNPGSWKVLFRCWLGSWIAVVILIPQASLNVLGNTYVIRASYPSDEMLNREL